MAPNRRAQERERAAARAAAEAKRAEAERKAIAEAGEDRPMIVALIFDCPFARLGRLWLSARSQKLLISCRAASIIDRVCSLRPLRSRFSRAGPGTHGENLELV